jgi:SPP1 gp7 family putative phage head morphogenesis protein
MADTPKKAKDKFPKVGESLSAKLARLAVERSIYFERVKNAQVREIISMLNTEVLPDLLARLEIRLARIQSRGYDSGPITTQRYKDMIEGIREILTKGMSLLSEKMRANLYEVAKAEAKSNVTKLSSMTEEFGFEATLPSAATLRSLVTTRPILGKTVREWYKGISKDTENRVVAALRSGIAEGQTVEEMMRTIRGTRDNNYADGLLQTTRRQVESLVRTSANYVSTHAREVTYQENDDIVKGVQIVATLDNRTSPICRARDGEVYPVLEGPRPPFHPNCRTTTSPVLKSWKELGIDLKDAPEGVRESLDGGVPASMTYEEWLRKKELTNPGMVNDILGKGRAELWRKDGFTVGDFVDDKGRTLTLDELHEIETGSLKRG